MTAEVRVTANFVENMREIQGFLEDADAAGVFVRLNDELFSTVAGNLARFPDIGVDLLGRSASSIEALRKLEVLRQKLDAGGSLREYLHDDFLLLYLVRGSVVYLLAIKHHRQLSYDFGRYWSW